VGDVDGAGYADEDDMEVHSSLELSDWLLVRSVVSGHAQAAPWAVCLHSTSVRGYYTAGKWRLPTEERCKINKKSRRETAARPN